jgi:hypothetical protein
LELARIREAEEIVRERQRYNELQGRVEKAERERDEARAIVNEEEKSISQRHAEAESVAIKACNELAEVKSERDKAITALVSIVDWVNAMPPGTWVPSVVTLKNIAEDALK